MLENGHPKQNHMSALMQKVDLAAPLRNISTKVVSCTPGRLRLRIAPQHRQSREIERITNALKAHPQINDVRVNAQHGSITINHNGADGNIDNVFAILEDLGIIFGGLARVGIGKSQAATGITDTVVDLNQRVAQASGGIVDLRFLFPLGLGTLAVRQLLAKGLQFEIIPWYVLAWYAFDSFIKLHGTSNQVGRANNES
jgi:hypothetical protein